MFVIVISLSHCYLHASTRFISSRQSRNYHTKSCNNSDPHEWYKLDSEIRCFERISIFKTNILKFIEWYMQLHLLTSIKIITRLQLDLSHVRERKLHFVKYRCIIWFPGAKILRKGTISTRCTEALSMIQAL